MPHTDFCTHTLVREEEGEGYFVGEVREERMGILLADFFKYYRSGFILDVVSPKKKEKKKEEHG